MTSLTKTQVIAAANSALTKLGTAQGGLKAVESRQNAQIQAVKNRHQQRIESLEADILGHEARIVELWEKYGDVLRDSPQSKTATLRSGTIAEKRHPVAIGLGDIKQVLAYLRKQGALRRFTKQPPRTVSKDLLKQDVSFVDSAPPGVIWREQGRTLHINPATTPIESKRDLTALRVQLGSDPTD